MWYPPCRPSCLLAAVVSVPRAMWAAILSRFSCRRAVRFSSSVRLMLIAVCLDASLHLSPLVLGCMPFPSVCLGSCLSPLYSVIDVGACAAAAPWLLAPRPASSTRRAGRYDGAVAALGVCLLVPSARHLIRAVRRRMATGLGACLVRLPHACSRPVSIVGSACYPARSFNPISLPSCRPAAQSTHRPSSLIARHGGRGGVLWPWLLACSSARSLLPFRFRLRVICAGSVEDGVGGCLACLAIVLCILSMGDGISAAVRVRSLIAWTRPLTRFLLRPPLRRISAPGFFSSSFHCPDSLPLFFRRATPRSPT